MAEHTAYQFPEHKPGLDAPVKKQPQKRTHLIFNQRYKPTSIVLTPRSGHPEKTLDLLTSTETTNVRFKLMAEPSGFKTFCLFCDIPTKSDPNYRAEIQFTQCDDDNVNIRAELFLLDGTSWTPRDGEKPDMSQCYMRIRIVFDQAYSRLPPQQDRIEPSSLDCRILDSIATIRGSLDIRVKPWMMLYDWILNIHEPLSISYHQKVLTRWWRDRKEFQTTWLPMVKKEYELTKEDKEKSTLSDLLAEFEEIQVFTAGEIKRMKETRFQGSFPDMVGGKPRFAFRVTLRPSLNFKLPMDRQNQPLKFECKEGDKFRLRWLVPGERGRYHSLEGTVSAEDEHRCETSPTILVSMGIIIKSEIDPRKATIFDLEMIADRTIYDRQVAAISHLAKPRTRGTPSTLKPEEVFLLGTPASQIPLKMNLVNFYEIWHRSLLAGGLDAYQTTAAMNCLQYNASVLQGPPGSGKSFTLIQTVIAFFRAQFALATRETELDIERREKEEQEVAKQGAPAIDRYHDLRNIETEDVADITKPERPKRGSVLEEWYKKCPHVLVTASSNYAVNQLLEIWHHLVNQPAYRDVLQNIDSLVVRYLAENLYQTRPDNCPVAASRSKNYDYDDVSVDDDDDDIPDDDYDFDDRWSWPLLLESRNSTKTQFPCKYSYIAKQEQQEGFRNFLNLKRRVAAGRISRGIRSNIHKIRAEMDRHIFCEALLVFATTSSSSADPIKVHFCPDVVFVDEAGQLSEIETCVAIAHPSVRQVVLAGDQTQLSPINSHQIPFFQMSGLEKIANIIDIEGRVSAPSAVPGQTELGPKWTLLRKNYRSVRGIVEPVSKMFYRGLLQHTIENKEEADIFTKIWTEGCTQTDPPSKASCILWHDVPRNSVINDPASMRKINHYSARAIVRLLSLIESRSSTHEISPAEIVVIAMYSAQVGVIKDLIRENLEGRMRYVRVTTVNGFQGRECPYVIVDLVRSTIRDSRILGFLRDHRRINVAISRAEFKTIIFGDISMYGQSEAFEYGERSKCLFDLAQGVLSRKNQSLLPY
ncbi:hypothetical protein TWF506_008130 [Arthrobotrys conoides]|uniref:DNA2/NAM7 helicase-like C-terminal domain-containing protein n=1 Tax=Arthrobotrys conoides TaxID=74498 RepID=A0AAN8NDZ5_9PEZI